MVTYYHQHPIIIPTQEQPPTELGSYPSLFSPFPPN